MKNWLYKYIYMLAVMLLVLMPSMLRADGAVVNKVYHPYVVPLEKELEWRATLQQDDDPAIDGEKKHWFAYGQSLSDSWFGEVYLIGEKSDDSSFAIEAYEIELKHQVTEQGEYPTDWGLLFELEKERNESAWEAAAGVLAETQKGKWVYTGNLLAIYEWGSDVDDELESSLALQARYRYDRHFEPAIELYAGEDGKAIGPVILGTSRLSIKRKLHWELGVIFGFSGDTADETIRALLEFEF